MTRTSRSRSRQQQRSPSTTRKIARSKSRSKRTSTKSKESNEEKKPELVRQAGTRTLESNQKDESTTPHNSVSTPTSQQRKSEAYVDHVTQYTAGKAFRATHLESPETPRSIATLVLFLGSLSLHSLYPNHVEEFFGITNNLQRCVLGLLVVCVSYCFLHTRDSLVFRPHPAFWRIFHGLALHYLFCITMLTFTPALGGIEAMGELFPSVTTFRRSVNVASTLSTDAAFANSPELQVDNCELSVENIVHQLKSMWFYAHAIGFWAKFCVVRDWRFAIAQSLFFEFLELSLQWLIPEFRECWWDSMILDFMCANMLGIVLGVLTLRVVNARDYNWVGNGYTGVWWPMPFTSIWQSLKNPTNQNGDESKGKLAEYNWSFFQGWSRFGSTVLLFFFAIIMEVNSFFLIHTLSMPAQHWIFKYRLVMLCFASVCAVAEHFRYIESTESHKRMGHNAWLLVVILLVELVLMFKYGTELALYATSTVPPDVYLPWTAFLLLGLYWCHIKFDVENPQGTLLKLWKSYGGWVALAPMLLLTRNYI